MAANRVSSTPFSSGNRDTAFNASGVAHVGAGRFLFIDNHDGEALYELLLDADGAQREPVRRRPLTGLPEGALSDPEGLTAVRTGDHLELVMTSSLSRPKKQPHDGLVRIRYARHGELIAESMPGFRDWLVDAHPELAAAAAARLDDGGLNIEGLTWDPNRAALLFGVRSPVLDGLIPVLCVRVDLTAPWTTAALHPDPPLAIQVTETGAAQGIRGMTYDHARGRFLVILGGSVRRRDARSELRSWNGCDPDSTALDISFDKDMKPEGLTVFEDCGRPKVLIVDDCGGFAVVAV
jgi:hypothetical protein